MLEILDRERNQTMTSVLDVDSYKYASINGVIDEPLLIVVEFAERYWLAGMRHLVCDIVSIVTDTRFNLQSGYEGHCIVSVAKKNCTLFTADQVREFEALYSEQQPDAVSFISLCQEIDTDYAILNEQARNRLKEMVATKHLVDLPLNPAKVVW